MPPVSNMRGKPAGGGGTTTTVSHINDFGAASGTANPRRTASGRAVRVNTTRPSNYYARPLGNFTANAANNDVDSADDTPGFYPALQFFTDAVTALPREMARQFTVMHEAQAKIHGLDERFQEMLGGLLELPVPVASGSASGLASLGRGMLSFTANNSLSGSASASVVNGGTGGAGNSNAASVSGEDESAEEDIARRQKYHDMGMVLKEMLPNMEEKNNGLLEVNRRLNLQLSRIDSVMPHIDEEISEEARYGSMTHWAYSDNRQKKQAPATGANRRDVAATNSLAAAANAIHETEIAQARRDATRETAREKHKGRAKDVVDSDFDDKPKKTHAKAAKNKALGQAGPSGLGISANGEPVKRRKVDKGLAGPAMERSASGAGKGPKGAAAKDGPRSTPNAEPGKKASKAKPVPAPLKRKGINSAQASPALASSPLHSSFTNTMEQPAGRPQAGRFRQNSTTNLRHERAVGENAKRPDTANGKANGEKVGSKRKARADEDAAVGPDDARNTIEMDDTQMRQDDEDGRHPSRSGSNSGKAGRGSKAGTPRNEHFPDAPSMKRTRSTRSIRGNHDESSSEPHQVRGRHKRHVSNSHLVKQLAPFNRSPDLDRNRGSGDEDDDMDSIEGVEEDGEGEDGSGKWRRSPRKMKSTSRRNTLSNAREDGDGFDRGDGYDGNGISRAQSPLAIGQDRARDLAASPSSGGASNDDPPALSPANSPTPPPLSPTPPPPAAATTHSPLHRQDAATPPPHSDMDDDEDEEEQDPDSPSATRYCYCDRGSYGEMIGCDNPQCPREWFHLGCTDLKEMPGETDKWYCRDCRPIFAAREGKRGRVGRGGRGGR